VLRNVTWRIGPGERTGILGENGAGKSTLLNLITGALEPTSGRVRRGINTRVATLTQHAESLSDRPDATLSAMVKGLGTTTLADGSVMRPDDLLERLGFTAAQRLTPVGRLSGGQRRRLQLLLVMLSEPNVLVLDEPTNDLDTDVLAAMEDLLDEWPGTLVVVSHDRYLLERITDQQFAVVGGAFRHLPGGVDEYIALSRDRRSSGGGGIGTFGVADSSGGGGGATRRADDKESAAIERRLTKIGTLKASLHEQMAAHDQGDYRGLESLNSRLKALGDEESRLERRWLEIADARGGG
jgi:ABC-type Mn2+/Zn2+ transport system ATPase subunit